MVKTSRALVCLVGLLLAVIPATAVLAQEGGEGEKAGGSPVSTNACLAGMKWTAGNEGSPQMHPGLSCIDCHSTGEGPRFLVAGTVYRDYAENNDCYGVPDVVVRLTDAKGKVITMTTNAAGNFFLSARNASITFPFKATLILDGKTRSMATPQSSGNCLSCHTSKGVNGAPGRIIAPGG